jgi:uroporphyrinogen-III synthase
MKVLVTRPEAQAARTAARLQALGHEPLVAPVLRIAPTGEPPPSGPFDAVVVTSANAVACLDQLGRTVKSRPVFAVGGRTTDLMRDAGFSDVRAGASDATVLAALIRRSMPSGAALLHIAGRDRKEEPDASLRASGYAVTVWTAYAALPVHSLPLAIAEALVRREIGSALHYSPRSAAILRRLAEAEGCAEPLLAIPHVCLSVDVAEALDGARQIVTAADPTEDALLEALAVLDSRCAP